MDDSLANSALGSVADKFDRSRVRIVLVRARNPNNIGAVARAMHDFGFGDLRVVGEYGVPLESARSAVDASAVLDAVVQTADLTEALSGCSLVVGTTAVGERAIQHRMLGLQDAGALVRAGAGRVALLFGSEKTGLSNEELSFCDLLLTIPMQPHAGLRHASMNLGQAVAVCLWELVRDEGLAVERALEKADVEEVERVFTLLSQVLDETEYIRRHAATADAGHIRRLVHRMALGKADVPAWLGMLRQMLWKLRRLKAEEEDSG